MDMKRLFEELEKIVPLKKAAPYFAAFFIVGFLFIWASMLYDKRPNKYFYNTEFYGIVNEIYSKPKNTYFQIGRKWYLIKSEFIINICTGDSISKTKASFKIEIYYDRSNIKWQGDVKRLVFEQVEKPK
jgi:hypothetical protein